MNTDKYSLSGRVFHKVRENILSGKYQKGEELRENTLAEELGVSRTPVREALRQLELEGLVTIRPNKGAEVVGISIDDIEQIYEIRYLLEGICAKWAAKNITDQQLGELEETIYLSEFYAQKGHYDQVVEQDNRFHEILYEASHSRVLNHVLSDFHQYVQRVRMTSLSTPGRALHSDTEHKKIVEALRKHDGEMAQKQANQHMMNTMRNMDRVGWDNLID